MAQTSGLVQRLKVTSPSVLAWVYIGPAPDDTELLIILAPLGLSAEDAAYRAAMADALGTALVNQRPVVAFHGDNSAEITAVQIPA
jgi:hypothetical protein